MVSRFVHILQWPRTLAASQHPPLVANLYEHGEGCPLIATTMRPCRSYDWLPCTWQAVEVI